MSRIVYVSKCTIPGNAQEVANEVQRIVARAQVFNREHNITGLLLFSGMHFAQVLEGPTQDVQDLFNHIEKDDRHSETQVLVDHAVDHRAFGDWDMALTSIKNEEMADIITLFPKRGDVSEGKDKLIVSLMQSHLDYYGELGQ